MKWQEIIIGCQKGETAAQRDLFFSYHSTFFLVCRRYLKCKQDAEEVLMNGFLQIFKGLTKAAFAHENAFTAWMHRIMVNECLQWLRKHHQMLLLESTSTAPNTVLPAADELSPKEIFNLLQTLPTGYRTIFNLFVVEGYSHKEIAKLLSISENTSKSQLHKARQMLAKNYLQLNSYHAFTKK